jgi:ketosteroid isomerase-like protein
MSARPAPGIGTDPATAAAEIVETYLRLHMIPDPDAARAYCAPELEIRFTGNRLMHDPAEATAFNRSRYKWVKKKFGPTHVVAGGTAEETVVYQTGTLYGEWPDGTPFEGNRYVDRYVVRHGKIVKMEVWNDSAEWLLVRAGLVKP